MKPTHKGENRYQVTLSDGGTKEKYVHILVADAFLPNKPNPNAKVKFKNDDTRSYHVDNLEWEKKDKKDKNKVKKEDKKENNAKEKKNEINAKENNKENKSIMMKVVKNKLQ